MAYPTTAALVAASAEPQLHGLDVATQDELRLLAIKAVEQFCGQVFTETSAVRVLGAQGGHQLPLDKRLAEVTSIEVVDSSLDAADCYFNERHSALIVKQTSLSSNWVERVIREDTPPVFTSGDGTVTIDGKWGWLDTEIDGTDLAHPVHVAIRLDMENQALTRATPLAEAARTMSRMRSDSITEGLLTVRTSGSVLPIATELQMLLHDFIWEPVGRVA